MLEAVARLMRSRQGREHTESKELPMGMMNIAISNLGELKKQIDKTKEQSEKVIKQTVNDFKSRAQAWVSAAIVNTYNIKKADVKKCFKGAKKGPGNIKIKSVYLDNMQLLYSGRLLTPIHFGMKPGKPPARRMKDRRLIPGQTIKSNNDVGPVASVSPIAPYQVSVEVFKGKRKTIKKQDVFLGNNGGGKYIPFQRKGPDRKDVEVIRSTSVPQMITNKTVEASIYNNIEDGLTKRLEHHVNQELSKK